VLVIPGSFLGRQTPAIRQYHSHPGDDFWPVMEAIIGIDSCRREGSGDPATESFFSSFPEVRTLAINGGPDPASFNQPGRRTLHARGKDHGLESDL